jgi:type II secretory pathway pseudopilin PulG
MMTSIKKINKNSGVTLLETILVIALVVGIAGMSAPLYQSFQVRNELDVTANTVVQSMRRAQALSQSGEQDSEWGVYMESGSVILFKGTSYLTRDTGFDELFSVKDALVFTGLQEVVFDRLTGVTDSVGTATLTSSTDEVREIVVNAKGNVSF